MQQIGKNEARVETRIFEVEKVVDATLWMDVEHVFALCKSEVRAFFAIIGMKKVVGVLEPGAVAISETADIAVYLEKLGEVGMAFLRHDGCFGRFDGRFAGADKEFFFRKARESFQNNHLFL